MAASWVPKSEGILPARDTLGPLFLIVFMPVFVILLPYTLVDMEGSLMKLFEKMMAEGPVTVIYNAWYPWNDLYTWKIIAAILGLQLAVLKLVPGKTFKGPVSPGGNVPEYPANGFQAYCITMGLFILGAQLGFYKGGILVEYLGNIISSMNVFALIFCVGLYIKGLYFPSFKTDAGSSGSAIFDYYWGTELHPRIFGWDVKQVTNCRFGMMFWGLFMPSAIMYQQEKFGYVSDALWVNVGLQFIYITKFYIWETGYLSSYDIIHDRSGFYLAWGCLCFMPSVFSTHTVFLANKPATLGFPLAAAVFLAGAILTLIEFDIDHQRLRVRAADGKCNIWGKPAEVIRAQYTTEDGKTKSSLLVACGWYGLARHLHYFPELIIATLWVIPCYTNTFLPYMYPVFATILLVDRMYRIDARCARKYGKYWEEYSKKVTSMMIPGIL